ncbi:MAG: PQQ-binding-like beta-propeller repeat protein, partial [Planctomycetes bacterium]|nr:PQQ-binding-like beta-propeller repeat protein [Planctomycetota bacterium]
MALLLFSLWCGQSVRAGDWPQVQHDAAHTGYTADQPEPPFRLLWQRDLKEPTATASQVVVAEGKVFVTTGYGNLYALDRRTGETAWVYQTARPVLGSAACADGRVYVNSMDHYCHAMDAQSGKGLWKFRTGEGLWAAPVLAADKVFIGARDGFVYALDAEKGTQLWRSPVGGLVMCTPACTERTLYVAAGDMHVYALDAQDGRQLWKSPQIPGAAIREYWLVAAHGTVMLTSQLAYACHPTQQMIQQAIMAPYNQAHKDDPVLRDHETFGPLQEWLTSHPHHKTLLVLDAATGREKFVAPIVTVNGGSCIGPVPAVTPDGWAYTVYGNIQLTASGWAFFGRYNLKTGVMEPLITDRYAPKFQNPNQWHWQPKAGTTFGRTSIWDGGFSVIDQSWGFSIGGDMAFPVRDPGWSGDPPFHNYFKISARRDSNLLADWNAQARVLSELNLGTVGGGAMHNTCSPVAISGNCLFHKTSRSVVFAFAGASPSGSETPTRIRERDSPQREEPPQKARAGGQGAEIPRKPDKDNPNVLDGLSWLVDLNEGWPVLSRIRGHLPLDVYRRVRDNILTVWLGPDMPGKPRVERRTWDGVEATYDLESRPATVRVSRLSPAVL